MLLHDISKSAQRISNARPKGRWLTLGRELQRLEETSDRTPNGQSWSDALFDALRRENPSLSRSYFDKMCAADAYLKDLRKTYGSHYNPENFEGRSLTALDIARRLHTIDEKAALNLVDEIKIGQAGITEADLALSSARKNQSSSSIPARQRAWNLSRDAERILKKELTQSPQKFLGDLKSGELIWRPRTSRFGAGCSLMVEIASSADEGTYVGFETLVLTDGRERLGWHRRLGQIALSASFFTNYWIVLVAGQTETLVADIESLKLDNIGIAVVGGADQLVRVHHPKSITPNPDRRPMIDDAITIPEAKFEDENDQDVCPDDENDTPEDEIEFGF